MLLIGCLLLVALPQAALEGRGIKYASGPKPKTCPEVGAWRKNKTEGALACAMFYPDAACTKTPLLLPINGTKLPNATDWKAYTGSETVLIRPGCLVMFGIDIPNGAYSPGRRTDYYWEKLNDTGLPAIANASYEYFHCDCYTKNEAVLTCDLKDEWILLRKFDNHLSNVPAIFEYTGASQSVFGHGVAISEQVLSDPQFPSPGADDYEKEAKSAFVTVKSLRATQNATSCHGNHTKEILIEAQQCAFLLQQVVTCEAYRVAEPTLEFRTYELTNETLPCVLEDAKDTHPINCMQ